ncbi:ABC transporter ATP-binding protein [Brochothrix campestris]|uniref:ABC transporter bacitracin/multidrug-family ATP-binding protein n=1 Tax=Brochothrix campestris FSL F6-1037 TaxID=1265861 RepID=W7CH77_9LIST|nr:ABC transporter ATP-binding protein [Brochothrix campestris]EUJ36290.1 ABC transporter bacitracin/multidrug-family ATP-binding protein [Brochothrix campestris FSL F6-1037]
MLEVVGLSKCFKTKTVLSNVTFTIPTTGIHGLIGANGAGKTTTMKLLLGLLAPDEGTITFNGERVKPHQNAMTPSIGYLPDVPQFYGYLTAAEYLLLCGELAGQSPAERNQTTQTLLKKVGLEKQATQRIQGFSRGMKQRLGIAQALVTRPQLLICDEPTSALDPKGRHEVLALLTELKREMAIVLSTHLLQDAAAICDSVMMMHQGTIVYAGTLPDLYANYETEAVLLACHTDEAVATLRQSLATCAWAKNIKQVGTTLEVNVSAYDQVYPLLLQLLITVGLQPDISRVEPQLEQIYLEVIQ